VESMGEAPVLMHEDANRRPKDNRNE